VWPLVSIKIHFEEQGTVAAFQANAARMSADPDVATLLVLTCDANGWTGDTLDPILASLSVPVFGGVFPQIIHDRTNYERGTLLIGFPRVAEVEVVRGLSEPDIDYTHALTPCAEHWAQNGVPGEHTLIVLVDGLSKRIAALVESLFFCFGLEHNFIGGGAGSLSFEQEPCLFTNAGLLQDAALVVRLPIRSSVGVTHGWQSISDSMKVTESDRNVIRSLNWRPAFEVYRELVEAHSGWRFTDDNFFEIAKCYPFGINKLGSEVVVRDPLMKDEDGGLVCVGEVPRGSFVRLLNGSSGSLIEAAARARHLAEASSAAEPHAPSTALFIDCISRALFLGDRITEELAAAAGERTLFGALTLGEIANNGRDYLEFYNKTSVLALLHEPR
jgi:hypothetical protein